MKSRRSVVTSVFAVVTLLCAAGALVSVRAMMASDVATAPPVPARPKPPVDPSHPPKNVAIVVFDGVQVIDFAGPWEVLSQAWWNEGPAFNVYAVGANLVPVRTSPPWGGFDVTPNYTFETAPRPDIVVVPGGRVEPLQNDARMLAWLRDRAAGAQIVMSVCNGAFVLGKAGLLDGLYATTFYGMLDDLKTACPKTTVLADRRFVDNGKVITTAGLSSGIDGALHVVERFGGKAMAQSVALGMEYDWRPDSDYARGALADKHIRRMLGRNGFELEGRVKDWAVVEQEGDRDRWRREWVFTSSTSTLADMMKVVDSKIGASWKRSSGTFGAGEAKSKWTFTDETRREWRGDATLRAVPGAPSHYRLSIEVERI